MGNLIERQYTDAKFKINWGASLAITTASLGGDIDMQILARLKSIHQHRPHLTPIGNLDMEQAVHETLFHRYGSVFNSPLQQQESGA